jgi:hypothetical protein
MPLDMRRVIFSYLCDLDYFLLSFVSKSARTQYLADRVLSFSWKPKINHRAYFLIYTNELAKYKKFHYHPFRKLETLLLAIVEQGYLDLFVRLFQLILISNENNSESIEIDCKASRCFVSWNGSPGNGSELWSIRFSRVFPETRRRFKPTSASTNCCSSRR